MTPDSLPALVALPTAALLWTIVLLPRLARQLRARAARKVLR